MDLARDNLDNMVAIVMGVAGSGKTLIGTTLAKSLNWKFADADDFHPPDNIEKMTRGIPLTDEDREPWLRAMRDAINGWIKSGENAVLACSALKQRYRDQLSHLPETRFVYLKGTPDLIYLPTLASPTSLHETPDASQPVHRSRRTRRRHHR